eukprot:3873564-Pyramimonas_sp.AAC.1
MGDAILATLRIHGQRHGQPFGSSGELQAALPAAMQLRDATRIRISKPIDDPVLCHRSSAVMKGLCLHRVLEVSYHMAHRRYLAQEVKATASQSPS